MTLLDAVSVRSSLREYQPAPLTPLQQAQLEKTVSQCNARAGLHIRLLCGRPEPFAAFKGGGRIRGAQNCLLFAGPAGDPNLEEKCGYCGEELVLTAAAMGLGTCWVGGTYDRERCLCCLEEGDELVCAAAVGLPPEGRPAGAPRALKPPAQLAPDAGGAPAWFRGGVEAVRRAPSAMNRQGYRFEYAGDPAPDGGMARVRLVGSGSFALVDLGIAKLHFELGAHGGAWTWGDGGVFRKAAEEKSCGAVVWRTAPGGRQYLLARHNGGHWSFPKGHVEGAETERETAAREIREETGLTAEIDTGFRQVVTYSPKPGVVKDVVFFTAVPTGGQEHAQESEIAQLGWFSLREAAALVTYAADEEILLAAESYLEKGRPAVSAEETE